MGPNAWFNTVVELPAMFAYLDPGTGSFVLQLLLAGFLSGLYALKHYWMRLRVFMVRLPKSQG